MKQAYFSLVILIACCGIFSACTKQNTNPIPQPTMHAKVNADSFMAPVVVTYTSTSQLTDTSETLYIKGIGPYGTGDEIILSITNYKNKTGVFSIVHGDATATYIHDNNVHSVAVEGVVAISRINTNTLTGYFNFSTADGISVSYGSFLIDTP